MSNSTSWIEIPHGSHFSLANIPFGIISTPIYPDPRPAIAIGDRVINLHTLSKHRGFSGLEIIQPYLDVFNQTNLNAFAALGRDKFALEGSSSLPRDEVTMHLPMDIRSYTDFYAGRNHAYNVGVLFRGPDNALQPNYDYLPVGYAGRATSVVVSGTPIKRPRGQILEDPTANPKVPLFTGCRKLDYELELGAFLCRANKMGSSVSVVEARDETIFGFVLLNDWSARDIQAWEYVPLGPFNSKSFGSTISPWVVLADALEPFKGKGLSNENEAKIASYLKEDGGASAYDIKLEVTLTTPSSKTATLSRTTALNLLWSFPQMVAHHTVGGCPMLVGDLLGSGTISGKNAGEEGSMLEQNKNGKVKISLTGLEEERLWIEDGDTIAMTGVCGEGENLVGFGECVGMIEPANEL